MSEQSLRAALEKLTAKYEREASGYGGTASYRSYADELSKVLAAHPAEPAPVVTDEALEASVRKRIELTGGDWDDYDHAALRERERPVLEAAAPLLGPRPLLDRESVTAAIRAEVASYGITPSTAEPKAVDAVMKLARPMPDVQVGYDAVYAVIRGKQQSERPSSVEVNALIWSGVHAFIGAMGIDPKPSLKLDGSES